MLGTGLDAANAVLTRSASDLDDLTLSFSGSSGSLLLDEQFYGYGYGLEEIQFGDGTVWNQSQLRAAYLARAETAGSDTIYGFETNDTISGGQGNDTLHGGSGNDRFVFREGFGNDVIADFLAGANSGDLIELSNSIFSDYAAVRAAMSQSGSDAIISAPGSNSIILKNVNTNSINSDDFAFI